MQIHLPENVDSLIRQRAAAAGFGDRIEDYLTYLVAADECDTYDGPAHLTMAGKSRDEIDAMIDAGFASGVPTPMTEKDWQQLHARIEGPKAARND